MLIELVEPVSPVRINIVLFLVFCYQLILSELFHINRAIVRVENLYLLLHEFDIAHIFFGLLSEFNRLVFNQAREFLFQVNHFLDVSESAENVEQHVKSHLLLLKPSGVNDL